MHESLCSADDSNMFEIPREVVNAPPVDTDRGRIEK